MRRIAIINQKGGVGKTTTTVNLGAALARFGQRVLLVDLDPQGHLSLHFGTDVSEDQPSTYDVLVESTPVADAVVRARENVAIVPANIDLAGAEAELLGTVGREVILREALNACNEPFDILLIDCPPSLGVLTINALAAVDEVVIPLQAHFFGLQGLGKLLDTVSLVRQRINPKLRVSGIALCLFDAGTKLATEVVEDLAKFLNAARGTGTAWAEARLFDTRIRRNIKLAESASFGQTVFDYDAKSNGALDYESLAREVIELSPPVRLDPVVRPRRAPRKRPAPKPPVQVKDLAPHTVEPVASIAPAEQAAANDLPIAVSA
jgi:chromosome partitioning protein